MWFFLSAAFLELLGSERLLCSLIWRVQVCWPKGQCESPLALVWSPGIPFPAHGLLRLFSFFGSGSERVQPCWQLRGAELRLPTQCLGQYSPESRSMALHGTPQCPIAVPKAAARTLHRAVEGPLSLLSSLSACAVALWPGSEMLQGKKD